MPKPDHLVGLLDLDQGPLGLGGLLIFLAEVLAMKKIWRAATVELQLLSAGPETGMPLIEAVLPHIAGIDSWRYVAAFTVPEAGRQWPPDVSHHDWQSSVVLQRLYAEHGVRPELHMSQGLVDWAKAWLRDTCGGTWPIVVHLKNNPLVKGESNAYFPAWHAFMADQLAFPVTFILIGSELIDERITNLKNTIRAADFSLSLAQELALIECAGAFMGMSSGPGNMAILGRAPYVLYKNRDHHAAAMERELAARESFTFARTGQRFLRERETRKSLTHEFSRLLAYARARV